MFKKVGGGSVFLVLLVALCVWVADVKNLQLGIDLQGGTMLNYRVKPTAGVKEGEEAPKLTDAAEQAKLILGYRLDEFGLKELSLSVRGRDQLVVEVPGAGGQDVGSIKNVIEQAGVMDFHLVLGTDPGAEASFVRREKVKWDEFVQKRDRWVDLQSAHLVTAPDPSDPTFPAWEERSREIAAQAPIEPNVKIAVEYAKNEAGEFERDENGNKIVARTIAVDNAEEKVSGQLITDAFASNDERGLPCIAFQLSPTGATQFGNMTREDNVGKLLAVVLDNQAVQVASINNTIYGRGQITGSFTSSEIREVVTVLKAGSLPAKLVLQSEQKIGSALGQESVNRGMKAMAIGLALVIVFMAIYYMTLGLVADLALLVNMLLIFAAVVAFRNTLTFPGLAGLLLTVGMAVDGSILIFERIREERNRGKSLNQAVAGGYERAFSTIFDANLTTLITAFVLFQFGTGPVKGFAVVLSIGVITSFFTSIWVSRLLLSILMKLNVVKQLPMMQLIKGPAIDFLKLRRPALTVSVILIVVSLGTAIIRGGDAMGIDFTGGAFLQVNLKAPQSQTDMQARLTGFADDLQVQALSEEDGKSSSFAIRTRVSNKQTGEASAAAEDEGVGIQQWIEAELASDLAPSGFEPAQPTVLNDEMVFKVRVRNTENGTPPPGLPELIKGVPSWDTADVKEVQDPAAGNLYRSFEVRRAFDPGLNEDARGLVAALKLALQDSPQVQLSSPFSSVESIGPKVATDLQGKVFVALFISFAVVIFYISLRFHLKFGLAAIVAVVHDILITLGLLAVADLILGNVLNLKINLPVIAALLTTIGYSLNDTIVIFDRIRENLEGKKRDVDYVKIVNESINQTLGRTVLTSVTTFLVVLILLIWGGSSLQGFAFALCVGVVVGTYSSMYIASPALIYFNNRAEKRRQEILAEEAKKK